MDKKAFHILLVEDHDDTRAAIAKLLKIMGCESLPVGSAGEAINAASKQNFDLVISDLGLPDQSGYELMKQLHTQYNLKGIALSGFGMEQDQARSRQAGFDLHIVKPITVEALRNAINKMRA